MTKGWARNICWKFPVQSLGMVGDLLFGLYRKSVTNAKAQYGDIWGCYLKLTN